MSITARATLTGLVCLLLGSPALAGSPPMRVESTRSEISAERRAEHVASFDHVWRTIADRQWDPDFDTAGWERQRDRLRPRVEAAWTDGEARRAMNDLLGTLEKSHFGIIPASSYEVLAPDREATGGDAASPDAGPGDAGLTVRLRDGEFLVVRVRPGSAAAAAGVKPGWSVVEVDGMEVSQILDAAEQSAGVERVETICALAINAWLGGREGEAVEALFRTREGRERDLTLELGPAPGETVRFGNLPDVRVHQDIRTLGNGVGYYSLNVFMDPPRVMPAFEKFVRDHAEAPGLVIDMRGNMGGVIAMSTGMGGWFVDEQNLHLGTMHMPGSDLRLVLNPRDLTFRGPVAVLIDEASISNAELLAAGLKDIGRARVFGARSAGLLLPSVVERLANGDGFQYAIAGYTSASGTSPEGVGVEPDVTIVENAAGLGDGQDPVLRAALEWIAGASPSGPQGS